MNICDDQINCHGNYKDKKLEGNETKTTKNQ